MLVLVFSWDEFMEKPEELVDLLFGKVSIVCGIFNFERVAVFAFSRHDIGEWVETGVANWNPYGVVAFFVKKFD